MRASDYFRGGLNEFGFHNLILTSTRHPRRTDFGAHRRLTFLLRTSGFEDLPLSRRKPIPQHGVRGTPSPPVTPACSRRIFGVALGRRRILTSYFLPHTSSFFLSCS